MRTRSIAWTGRWMLACAALLVAGCSGDAISDEASVEAAADSESRATEESREDYAISEEEMEALAALGYVGGYDEIPEKIGVTIFEEEHVQPGFNLYSSGHAPEAILTDLQGHIVHTWKRQAPGAYRVNPERNFWRRVHLLPNGELLGLFDPRGILKLSRSSELIWASDPNLRLHHDLFVADDGRIYSLGKEIRVIHEASDKARIIDDQVVILSPQGELLERFSIWDAFRRSKLGPRMVATVRKRAEKVNHVMDFFHTNTIEVFDGSRVDESPLLAKGNMIFCSPHLDNVFVIDGETRTVVWNWNGPWNRIHHPTIVDDGNLLLFHNGAYKEPGDIKSQVLEYDFPSEELVWKYEGDPQRPETTFFSGTSSHAERLANGNTLIVVTEKGRALEVTPEGEIVWEFFNPKQAGEENELIASLFQLERIDRADVAPWLEGVEP